MKNLRVPIYETDDGDMGIRFFIELFPDGSRLFTNRLYKVNRIPDQYYGTDLEELEKLKNDKRVNPCPVCGYKIYVAFGGLPRPAWEDDWCRVCGHETIIEV